MSFNKGQRSQLKNLLESIMASQPPRRPLNDTPTVRQTRKRRKRQTPDLGSSDGPAHHPEASATLTASTANSSTYSNWNSTGPSLAEPAEAPPPPQQSQLTQEQTEELFELRSRFLFRTLLSVGLMNVGNSCYASALLQTLFIIPALRDWLFYPFMTGGPQTAPCRRPYFAEGQCRDKCFICRFTQVGFNMCTSKSAVSPKPFYDVVVNRQSQPQLKPDQQEDVYDLLMVIRNAFIEEMTSISRNAPNLMDDWFGFTITTTKKCVSCNQKSISTQKYIDLALDIHKDQVTNVIEALQLRFLDSTLTEIFCDHCKSSTNSTRTEYITEMPPYLWMKLNRFRSDQSKNMKLVRMNNCIKIATGENEEEVYNYRLKAVIYHHGTSPHNGHYFAVVRSPDDRKLIKFDDAQPPQAVNTWELVNHTNATAYLLLFEQVPEAPSLGVADDPIVDLCYEIIELQRTSAVEGLGLSESDEVKAVTELQQCFEWIQGKHGPSEQPPTCEGLTTDDRSQMDKSIRPIVEISSRINEATGANNTLEARRLTEERDQLLLNARPILANFEPTSSPTKLTEDGNMILCDITVSHFFVGTPVCFNLQTFKNENESREHFTRIVEMIPAFEPKAEEWTAFLVKTAKRWNSGYRKLLIYLVEMHQQMHKCQECNQ